MRLPDPWVTPVVSIEQAARLVGMSRAAAYRAVAGGELPTISLAGRRVVPVAALYRLLALPVPGRGGTPVVDRSR